MFEPETVRFLQSGCALIVGTVDADGAPYASRGWGLDVLDPVGTVRLLLDAADETTVQHLRSRGAVAITATHVPTLHSLQMKGHATAAIPANDADRARKDEYADAFFGDINATEGTPLHLPERMRPDDVVVCTVTVEDLYDQTPGPGAGRAVEGSA